MCIQYPGVRVPGSRVRAMLQGVLRLAYSVQSARMPASPNLGVRENLAGFFSVRTTAKPTEDFGRIHIQGCTMG